MKSRREFRNFASFNGHRRKTILTKKRFSRIDLPPQTRAKLGPICIGGSSRRSAHPVPLSNPKSPTTTIPSPSPKSNVPVHCEPRRRRLGALLLCVLVVVPILLSSCTSTTPLSYAISKGCLTTTYRCLTVDSRPRELLQTERSGIGRWSPSQRLGGLEFWTLNSTPHCRAANTGVLLHLGLH